MGKVTKPTAPAEPLVLRLEDAGMTPMMRAGLGGLAASLLAISRREKGHTWPERIALGPGHASVEPRQITLRWGIEDREPLLKALFEASFQIRDDIICLPGMFGPNVQWDVALGAAIQGALKRTFLQHGKSTQKNGSERVVTMEPDTDIKVDVSLQPYGGFAHQEAWEDVLKSFKSEVRLAGWANPGAVGRHNAYSDTELVYTPAQALAGLFSIVGCLPYQVTGDASAGALVIAEPEDLVHFAQIRSALTPHRARGVYVAGTSDAVLCASLALRAYQQEHPAIVAMHGTMLRSTAWASQQKSRVATMRLLDRTDERYSAALAAYEKATNALPTRIILRKPTEPPGGGKKITKKAPKESAPPGYFAAASALRGFIAENLAAGRPWFEGFATAKVGLKRPRYLHQFRQQDNLGALLPGEKKGLWTMIETTKDPEKILITSVHTALRQRFGAIWDETKNLPAQTRKNRMNGERERWRLAFAKAKTHGQVRAALADLWSRAGTVRELKESWPDVLRLLQPDRWAHARDLALIALASYRGKESEEEATETEEDTTDDSEG